MRLLKSKTGQWIPVVNEVLLHSRYSPEREAESFGREVEAEQIVIVVGLAFGYHLARLRSQAKKLLVVEPNEILCEQFFQLFSKPDFPILSGNNATLFKQLDTYIEKDELRRTKILIHQPSLKSNPSLYEPLIQDLHSYLERNLLNLITDSAFGQLWTYNVLKNLRRPLMAPMVKNISSSPVFLLGSGYTARASIPFLQENQRKIIILAIPPVLELLAREGILPDGVFLVDAGQANRHYGSKAFSVPLFTYLSSSSDFIRHWAGEVFFLNSGIALEQFLIPEFPLLPMSGSVANSLLDFSAQFSHEIFMAGFDFSFVKGFYHYPGNPLEKALLFQSEWGKALENQILALMNRGNRMMVVSGDEKPLVTNKAMSVYYQDFCGKLMGLSNKKTYVLSKAGAKLPGTTLFQGNLQSLPDKKWEVSPHFPIQNLSKRLEDLKNQFLMESSLFSELVKMHFTRMILKKMPLQEERLKVVGKIELLLNAIM